MKDVVLDLRPNMTLAELVKMLAIQMTENNNNKASFSINGMDGKKPISMNFEVTLSTRQ